MAFLPRGQILGGVYQALIFRRLRMLRTSPIVARKYTVRGIVDGSTPQGILTVGHTCVPWGVTCVTHLATPFRGFNYLVSWGLFYDGVCRFEFVRDWCVSWKCCF